MSRSRYRLVSSSTSNGFQAGFRDEMNSFNDGLDEFIQWWIRVHWLMDAGRFIESWLSDCMHIFNDESDTLNDESDEIILSRIRIHSIMSNPVETLIQMDTSIVNQDIFIWLIQCILNQELVTAWKHSIMNTFNHGSIMNQYIQTWINDASTHSIMNQHRRFSFWKRKPAN